MIVQPWLVQPLGVEVRKVFFFTFQKKKLVEPLVQPLGVWFAINISWMGAVCYFLIRLMKNLESNASGSQITRFTSTKVLASLVQKYKHLMKNLESNLRGSLTFLALLVQKYKH
jgi:hypothetical protein